MEEIKDSSEEVTIWKQPAPEPTRHPSKEDSHVIGVSSFKTGEITPVEVDELVLCVPTKDCVQFWVTIGVCALVVVITIIGIALLPVDDARFQVCIGFFGLAWGVLVPSPSYKTAFKKPRH